MSSQESAEKSDPTDSGVDSDTVDAEQNSTFPEGGLQGWSTLIGAWVPSRFHGVVLSNIFLPPAL